MLFSLLLYAIFFGEAITENAKQTNLLFIMFDDLRPELSFYGRNHMITPNFERLAAKSVIFDHAYCQVAVCNPSRNSMLTGLRPDTSGSYNFDRGYDPFMPFPAQLVRSGYNTAGVGKIVHWESNDKKIWSFDSWNDNWYDYQSKEDNFMKSSVMPDKTRNETDFKDYKFTTRAISALESMVADSGKYFMLGIGFKLPHLALHIPYRYFDMYKGQDKKEAWKLSTKERRFPVSLSEISYRCCSEQSFRYMREEGAARSDRSAHLGDINAPLPEQAHDELMMGYSAAVTFLDTQVGRLLDVLDELHLWENTTVVLTSDHGMHNGEKGIWEKWSLFEESTRVPLLVAHPLSPYQGQHYAPPVELVDIYPTLNDLLRLPLSRQQVCSGGWKCRALDGKSLATVVLGHAQYDALGFNSKAASASVAQGALDWLGKRISKNKRAKSLAQKNSAVNSLSSHGNGTAIIKGPAAPSMPVLDMDFAISQVVRCAPRSRIPPRTSDTVRAKSASTATGASGSNSHNVSGGVRSSHNTSTSVESSHTRASRVNGLWGDCEMRVKKGSPSPDIAELSLLGYSMRTLEYRYTAYYPFNRTTQRPDLLNSGRVAASTMNIPVPYEEELFDHKNETLSDFTHREIVNLAYRPSHESVVLRLRKKLLEFIRRQYKQSVR